MSRLHELRGTMRVSEVRVADFVLANPYEVIRMTVDGLAKRTGVSTTSVLRFAQALGFDGFTQFRMTLAVELDPLNQQSSNSEQDPLLLLVKNVFHADMQAIAQTLELLDLQAFRSAISSLSAAQRIVLFSVGLSAPIALDAASRFLRIGLDARAQTDSHLMAVSASQLSAGDCAVAISHSGRSPETIAAAELASKAGATVIAITSYPNTPLLRHADQALITAVSETSFRVQAMASRIAHLTIIDALYTALAEEDPARSREHLELSNGIIEQKRNARSR